MGNLSCNYSKIRKSAYDAAGKVINEGPMPDNSEKSYLYAYYLVVKNNCLMNIPVWRLILPYSEYMVILLFYLVALCSSCALVDRLRAFCVPCDIAIGITVLLIILPFVWYKLQSKVSYLVWEGAYFISKIQKDEKNNSN